MISDMWLEFGATISYCRLNTSGISIPIAKISFNLEQYMLIQPQRHLIAVDAVLGRILDYSRSFSLTCACVRNLSVTNPLWLQVGTTVMSNLKKQRESSCPFWPHDKEESTCLLDVNNYHLKFMRSYNFVVDHATCCCLHNVWVAWKFVNRVIITTTVTPQTEFECETFAFRFLHHEIQMLKWELMYN